MAGRAFARISIAVNHTIANVVPDHVGEVRGRRIDRIAKTTRAAVKDRLTKEIAYWDHGYDIESRVPGVGKLRFIEVKGRASGAQTITVTKNEILYSLNKPEDFILAIVEFLEGDAYRVHYVRQPFHREPDFHAHSVNYGFAELLSKANHPA
jgi:hypothetical protein